MAEKVICDTDVMIDYWDAAKPRHSATKSILENEIGLDNIVLSAVTKIELLAGVRTKAEMQKLNKRLEKFSIALINEHVTILALELFQTYHLSHRLAFADSLIASTAIITELKLFTYNVRDYRFIKGIGLYKTV